MATTDIAAPQKGKKRKKPAWIRVARTVSRIASFLLVPILFIDAYDVFRLIVRSVVDGKSLDVATIAPQLLTLLLLLGSALLVGRVFCGWMCAFGSYGDLVRRLGAWLTRDKRYVGEKPDRRLRCLKYAVLLVPVVFALLPGGPDLSSTSPWDAFGMIASSGPLPDFGSAAAAVPVGAFLLLLVTVGSIYVDRFFCRYLCPLGAMFSLVSRSRFLTLSKPTEKCGRCRVCTNRCSMGLELYKTEVVTSGECIQCMACVEACPRRNIVPLAASRKVRPLVAALAVVVSMAVAGLALSGSFGGGATGALSSTSISSRSGSLNSATDGAGQGAAPTKVPPEASGAAPSRAAPTQVPTAAAGAAKYKDGTYQGSGIGFRNQTTTVSVTIVGGRVASVVPVSTGDSRSWFSRAFGALSRLVLGKQAAVTDIVGGATYSSRGIDGAVANALSKAAVVS